MVNAVFVREQTEETIKEKNLDRSRVFEVSKLRYAAILSRIEEMFVAWGHGIHWANMGYFRDDIPCTWQCISGNLLWYHDLPRIVPDPGEPVYVVLEGCKGYNPKYWLYEMYLPELITILDETAGLDDFYIVSKKYRWLISENHEEIAAFVGEGMNLSEVCG